MSDINSFRPISIELFSGQATFSKLMQQKGYEAISLDINPKFNPSICCDILDYTPDFIPGSVAAAWASPDCQLLSRAADSRHWSKETIKYRQYRYTPMTDAARRSLAQVNKTIDIIKSINPRVWFIENPIGRIHHLSALKSIGHYRYAVNYANWGFPYSKETYIFTNTQLCLPILKVHSNFPGLRSVNNRVQRSAIPVKLLEFLISQANL